MIINTIPNSNINFGAKVKVPSDFPVINVFRRMSFPHFKTESDIISPENYDENTLKIIQAIKESRGFRKFFKRYRADSIDIESTTSNIPVRNALGMSFFDCDCSQYFISIENPVLRGEYKSSKKSIIERLSDLILPPKDKKDSCGKFVQLTYDDNERTPSHVRRTSYLKIMLDWNKILKLRQKLGIN